MATQLHGQDALWLSGAGALPAKLVQITSSACAWWVIERFYRREPRYLIH